MKTYTSDEVKRIAITFADRCINSPSEVNEVKWLQELWVKWNMLGPKPISVGSSHGSIEIDQNGNVMRVTERKDSEGELSNIIKFDVNEYKSYYNVTNLPSYIDILDLGYTTKEGLIEPPAMDWRKEFRK